MHDVDRVGEGKTDAALLDRFVRPEVRLGGRVHSAFHVCGITGFILAMVLSVVLVRYQGLAVWVMGAVILGAVATFFALAMITKIVLGEERLVYYHHEIAVMATSALLLWGIGQPVLPYLDATILGVGTFLVCGRVGCLMVGCCHGRPHGWGVCYRLEHAAVGFVPYLVGVRLFPVQAAESLWVLAVVVVGVAIVLGGAPSGAAFAWYIVAYDIGRFSFEFVRGDPKRAYWGGFSEGQWTSLLLMVGVVAAEGAGWLPFQAWHVAATAGMVLVMLGLSVHRKHRAVPTHRLLSARHVKEVAEALPQGGGRAGSKGPRGVRPVTTSLGLRLSAGRVEDPLLHVEHYTMSSAQPMSRKTAEVLSGLICRLRPSFGEAELVAGEDGVFHLVRHVPRPEGAASGESPARAEGGDLADAEDTGSSAFGLRLQRG
jgi:prolipoprotein diacylglyceryltransferase